MIAQAMNVFPSLFGIIVLGALLLGAIALVAWLIANKATRLFGVLLLGFGGFFSLLFVLYFGARVTYVEVQQTEKVRAAEQQQAAAEAEAAWREVTKPRIELNEDADEPPSAVVTSNAPNDTPQSSEAAAAGRATDDPSDEPAAPTPTVVQSPARPAELAGGYSGRVLSTDDPEPDWVKKTPVSTPDQFVRVVESGPYSSTHECFMQEDRQVKELAVAYVKDHLPAGASIEWLSSRRPAAGFSEHKFIKDRHLSELDTSLGGMYVLRSLVVIDRKAGAEMVAEAIERSRENQLTFVALIAGGVLALVALAYALLKIDEATRGYYSKRLLIGAPVAIFTLLFCIAAALFS